jgi:NAD(P) transhydrogenase subunit alpha
VILGVPRETAKGERRVSLVPESIAKLAKAGFEVVVEAGAGSSAFVADGAYEDAGARVESDRAKLFAQADLVTRVHLPGPSDVTAQREGSALVAPLSPFTQPELVRTLAARRITSFALDLMPRVTRAQSMDVLSAMSTIAGYRAVLLAGAALPRLMPMLTTAAGTLKAARVLVIGAGVAGLQAIATARRLGAVVEAFDIRAAAKEQVQSLGARFVEDKTIGDAEAAGGYAKELTAEQQARQRQLLAEHIAAADAVICTALVPGRPAPVLVREEQVKAMRPGSVIVDLAAEAGGNCALTRPGETVEQYGVSILGPVDLPAGAPQHASQMFSRNVMTFLVHLVKDGALQMDLTDEITAGTLVTHGGRVVHAGLRPKDEPAPRSTTQD